MDDLLLAADIGGTKTNIALYRPSDARMPVAERHYRNQEFDALEDLLRRFMEETGHSGQTACFAVAGAVSHGSCHMPNLGWHIKAASIRSSFGFRHVALLNDLAATAHGIATLRPGQFVTIQAGTPDPQGNCALIAAGTGLGEALMIRSGHDMIVSPSEGGHADFAPKDEQQIALLRFLQERYGHASWERVISGNGLKNLYDCLAAGPDFEVPACLAERIGQAEDPAAVIAESALQRTSAICVQAMALFMRAYGAEAGNLALKALAAGGVYIAGGIAPKILPAFQAYHFLDAFLDKGRFSAFMAEIPVHVILEPRTALQGAAAHLLRIHDRG